MSEQNGTATIEGSLEMLPLDDEELERNLKVIAPLPVEVTFFDGDAERTAKIKTRVPMSVFHEMLGTRQKVRKEVRRQKLAILRSTENDGTEEVTEMLKEEAKEVEQEIMTRWLVEQVLAVWRRTEPDMTFEQLENGLEFEQVEALFSRFFGGLMRQKRFKDRLMHTG
jgi:molecular chaperone DnaK (HSP70)